MPVLMFITAVSIKTKSEPSYYPSITLGVKCLIFGRSFSHRCGPGVLWLLPGESVGLPRGVVAEISCQVLS